MRGTWRWTPTPSCRRPARRRTTARPRRSAAPWSWTTAAAARTPARRRRTLPTIRSRKSRLPCRRSLGRSCFSLLPSFPSGPPANSCQALAVSSLARKLLLLLCCLASEGGRPSPIYRGGRARRGRPGCTESPLRRHPAAGIGRRNVRTTCCARRREATISTQTTTDGAPAVCAARWILPADCRKILP